MLASEENLVEVVVTLCEWGANLELQDHRGWTALATASVNGQSNVVTILCEKGANLESLEYGSLQRWPMM